MGAGASSVAHTYIHQASAEEIAAASQDRETFLSELAPDDRERFLADLHEMPVEEREQFLANLSPEDREKFLAALAERAAAAAMPAEELASFVIDQATRWWMLPSMQTNYVFHNEAPILIEAAA
jgi:Mg/Co/Ni transporter MgtE